MDVEKIIEKYCPLEIGNGWYKIVEPLFNYIEEYNADKKDIEDFTEEDEGKSPKIKVYQCKEKFGGLRFYVGYATDALHALIDKAEKESFHTCERCGKPGKTRNRNLWLATLCDECAKELGYD